ncbi:phosphatase PAP2 family protein [Noviherbaspirillum denitrificans]|uniref:PA-phosphatase n=1 Tax=Noviherbaspirillum denitrificans TaxID=1968433 RepID=A0A254TBW4_9BURK|nr:phosphatase PAP2 family protein [Noviherbaspirillum denitrificans]OWW20130.1 PA-phosphatase [Noviherbaspirillum denitrificans]
MKGSRPLPASKLAGLPALRNWLEPRILGAIIVATGSLWAFIEIAEAVIENETRGIDTAILLALRSPGHPAEPLGPAWLQEMIRDITALGSPVVLSFVVVVTVIVLILSAKRRSALFVAVATGGGAVLSSTLKHFFNRPRPELVPHSMAIFSPSFPSGHALLAAVVYFTLAALLARLLPTWRLKLIVLIVAAILTAAVGVSRVYLGVHWPSDVLGGWAAGAAWALGCWLLAERLKLGKEERA